LRAREAGGSESEGGAGIPFPRTPFPSRPARANFFQKSASGLLRKKVRISFRRHSHFVKFAFFASLGVEFTPHTACCCARPLASADEFSSNFENLNKLRFFCFWVKIKLGEIQSPTIDTVQKIAKALGVGLEDLTK